MHLIGDFIMKLPLVIGKNTILVVCDQLSKMVHFIATMKETTVKELVQLFIDKTQKLHDFLKSIISDRRPQFAVDPTRELNKMLGTKTKLLTAFHSQIISQNSQ